MYLMSGQRKIKRANICGMEGGNIRERVSKVMVANEALVLFEEQGVGETTMKEVIDLVTGTAHNR